MSFDGERERELILDLFLGRISEEEFLRRLPRDATAVGTAILKQALQEKDPEGIEDGLLLCHRFGVSNTYLDVLLVLAGENWHHSHEDVIAALDVLRAPSAIPVLYRTALAQYAYLAYDDAFALGTKCVWALGNIETTESVERLRDLLRCGNPILEENAREQLVRVADEASSEQVRLVARDALAEGRPGGGDE